MELQLDKIVKHLTDEIATKAQEIAVLKATIDALTEVKPTTTTTTSVPEKGTQGLKPKE